MVDNDRDLLAEVSGSRGVASDARAAADLTRVGAIVAEDAAADEQAGLVQLVEAQRKAVLAVEARRRRPEAVMTDLEQDSEVSSLLGSELQEQIGALEAPPSPPPPSEPEPRAEPTPRAGTQAQRRGPRPRHRWLSAGCGGVARVGLQTPTPSRMPGHRA